MRRVEATQRAEAAKKVKTLKLWNIVYLIKWELKGNMKKCCFKF